ncbi:MAG: hypothetical protein IPP79_12530 [Chitinophagaceae bacterium]|nr:hypothetical protein [Chitinophagaceae bacterium]
MKKLLIGALVGGLLCLYLANTFMDCFKSSRQELSIHYFARQYLIQPLSSHFSEDGQYLLPNLPVDASMDDMTKFGETNKGKPWAVVSYHKSYDMNMGANIVRGLLTQILEYSYSAGFGKNSQSRFQHHLTQVPLRRIDRIYVHPLLRIYMV